MEPMERKARPGVAHSVIVNTVSPATGVPSGRRAGVNVYSYMSWMNRFRYAASGIGGLTSTLVTRPAALTQKRTRKLFPRTEAGLGSGGKIEYRACGGKDPAPAPPGSAPGSVVTGTTSATDGVGAMS